jgi:hypothetical protein
MCASPLSFFRAGPPPPRVVLLPDALFFTRTVPVSAGATAAGAATEVELALEAVSPFPLAQLYYGWFWTPGAERALVFAAYRRRFTTEQANAWAEAELVLPTFVAVAGAKVDPATTIVLSAPEGFTAVHWEKPGVPSQVLFRPVPAEAPDEDRTRIREDLLRGLGGSKAIVDLPGVPVPEPAWTDREVEFRAGEVESTLPAAIATNVDVRDKAELAALRAAHKRDLVLWRMLLGAAAALVLLAVGEFALMGGRMWQGTRETLRRGQEPVVQKIMAQQELANRINDLVTKRLLPFEMISLMTANNRKPADIQFTSVIANSEGGTNAITVKCVAANDSLVPAYEATLKAVPEIENVEERDLRTQGGRAQFDLVVTFKSESLRPADSISQQ